MTRRLDGTAVLVATAGFGAVLVTLPLYAPLARPEVHPHLWEWMLLVGMVSLGVASVRLAGRHGWGPVARLLLALAVFKLGGFTHAYGDRRATGGYVKAVDGTPVAGVLVVLDEEGVGLRSLRTDMQGRFRFALDPRRRTERRLLICPEGGIPWVHTEVPGAFTHASYGVEPRQAWSLPLSGRDWRGPVPAECGPVSGARSPEGSHPPSASRARASVSRSSTSRMATTSGSSAVYRAP